MKLLLISLMLFSVSANADVLFDVKITDYVKECHDTGCRDLYPAKSEVVRFNVEHGETQVHQIDEIKIDKWTVQRSLEVTNDHSGCLVSGTTSFVSEDEVKTYSSSVKCFVFHSRTSTAFSLDKYFQKLRHRYIAGFLISPLIN